MANETKFAGLTSLRTFLDNCKNLFATKTSVDELSTDVAYINVEDNENVENPDIESDSIVVDSALSETSTNPVQNKVVTAEINSLSEAIAALTLGVHTDGLVYIFKDGVPIGNGVQVGSDGDVVGYVDSANNIVVKGNLADGTYSVKYEMDDGSTVDIGDLVLDSNVYYSVTNNLTNCTTSNSATQAVGGQGYTATITANDGYALSSVVVTMGGNAVTVTDGVINIASVTGNIVITAVAEEKASEPTYTNKFVIGGDGYIINGRTSSTGADRTDANGCFVSNYIKVSNGDTVYVNQDIAVAYSGFKLSDGSTTAAMIPSDTTNIKNYAVSNGISQFTLNIENVEYVRICIALNNTNTSITETDVENAGVIITVNEPIV